MNGPKFAELPAFELAPALLELLPAQGSVELQHDQPGKVFSWHQHDLDEELFVLYGAVTLFWVDGEGGYRQQECPEGTQIMLPAGTVHGSTAGPGGARYIIKPEGGKTANTRFLPEAEWPYPPVAPAAG